MLLSWPQGHCESSLGSFDECSAAHKRPPTLRPSHVTWAVSPPVGSYRLQPPSPFIIITQPESWYSFTVPRRVEGWVDLGTAGKVHTARVQGCKSRWLCDKHNCPQRDSIPVWMKDVSLTGWLFQITAADTANVLMLTTVVGCNQGSSRTGKHGNAVPVLFYTSETSFWHQLEKRLKMRINDSRNKKLF